MKVLKDGKYGNPKRWKVTVICRKQDEFDSNEGCGAELEVFASDLILMTFYGEYSEHYYAAVKCPQCNHFFAVRNVPDPIWRRLNTEKNRKRAIFDGFDNRRVK